MGEPPDPEKDGRVLAVRLNLFAGRVEAVDEGARREVDLSDDPYADQLRVMPVEDLAAAKNAVIRLRRALSRIGQYIDSLIVADVRAHGPIRLGDSAYTISNTSTRRVLPGMAEPLLDYLGDDLRRCVNASDVKITGLRGVAATRGDDPQAVEQTFYETDILEEPELRIVPVAQRKWALALQDGERSPR
jgi:hypothetical protein